MPRTNTRQLRIRMYNVGFGDAFLVFIPTSAGDKTMLVDCGVHPNGVANTITTVAEDIVTSVTKNRKARIDVVVATHRHADHISGFGLKLWGDVEVGEVWLPWTEERGNPKADKIRRAQHRLAAALDRRFRNDTKIGWLALNSLSNKDAENMLLGGFKGDPPVRYLPDPDRANRTFRTPLLPGVKISALGPTHDPELIALLDPPKGEHFLRGMRAAASAGEEEPEDESLVEAPPLRFLDRYKFTPAQYTAKYKELAESLPDAKDFRDRANADWLGAAASLEDAINGTSLVLVLEIGEQTVLLAGDAEWGTWSEVLADDKWRDLLARTSLYKVSHHGSYNGTPKDFVDELLPADALSLVSLKAMKRWPSIPRKPLFTALRKGDRTLIQTNDMPAASDTITRHPDKLWIQVALPTRS